MNKKIRLLSLIMTFVISSCSIGNFDSVDRSESLLESSAYSSISEIEIEPADPDGFDPNFDYVGYDAIDFEIIASQYIANCQLKPEHELGGGYPTNITNYGVITFPFRGTSVVAFHKNRKITEVHRLNCEKLTLRKALSLGDFRRLKRNSYIYSYYSEYNEKIDEKKVIKEFIQCSYSGLHNNNHSIELQKKKYLDFFEKYGIPTSMFVYYNNETDPSYDWFSGRYYLGLVVETASAFPIYSDDLQDIVGVMTLSSHSTGIITDLSIYLKEDGFGEIKKIPPIIEQIRDPEVEVIENPCFYIEDASKLPRGDWRFILSEGVQGVFVG